jgi:hypothetical protein
MISPETSPITVLGSRLNAGSGVKFQGMTLLKLRLAARVRQRIACVREIHGPVA